MAKLVVSSWRTRALAAEALLTECETAIEPFAQRYHFTPAEIKRAEELYVKLKNRPHRSSK